MTVRYAVASNFETGNGAVERRFFTGAINEVGAPVSQPKSESLGVAWTLPSGAAAECVAAHLTDLSTHVPGARRTWTVVEIHPAIERRRA